MKLTTFQITNFRSINDSGPVSVGKLTSLVGRNESGKSNLLLGLRTLNPPGGPKDLNPIKDFPRHRRLDECTDETPVVSTTWELDAKEQAELVELFPRAAGVKAIEIGRYYKASRWVDLQNLAPLTFVLAEVAARIRKIQPVLEVAADKLGDVQMQQANAAIKQFATDLTKPNRALGWAELAVPGLAALRRGLAVAGIELADKEDGLLTELEELAATIVADEPAAKAARSWAAGRLPVFIYVEEYPELTGHQNITEYLARKNQNQVTTADRNFAKMCKVAGLDPAQLQTLHTAGDHETRNQLANRAGAVVTGELRRLWKDRQLKVRFSPDAQHLDTFVADPNSVYDVEVNLDERSRGLKWFFSFYIAFAADTSEGGSADNAILLLDEPGLYLHALSQADLLRHFSTDFANQIIYTTHSPFMVPTENLDAIRTVNIAQDAGTTVTDTPTGDSRTLFPLQMALGFSLSQSLFVGPDNLIVEGVTDFWMLSSVSAYLQGVGKTGLPKALTITPAGGAQKVGYMVALLTSERLRVLVLLDEEKQARGTRDELVKSKLIRDDGVLFVTAGFPTGGIPTEADLEDLLDPAVFDALVRESYKGELKGRKLTLNVSMPRIVKRYEAAFEAAGLVFQKTRPARLLLSKMANEPEAMMPATSLERFERLFAEIARLHNKMLAKQGEPFG